VEEKKMFSFIEALLLHVLCLVVVEMETSYLNKWCFT